jgi:hypothetical protein
MIESAVSLRKPTPRARRGVLVAEHAAMTPRRLHPDRGELLAGDSIGGDGIGPAAHGSFFARPVATRDGKQGIGAGLAAGPAGI